MVERARFIAALLLLCWAGGAAAQGVIDAFVFDDPAKELRYRALLEEIRCPKCINTNLAGSDAPIAADLRATIYRLIMDGASEAEVRTYLQARYGDFVLYDPPMRADTLALWLAPAVLLTLGLGIVLTVVLRRRRSVATLSDDEQLRLNELLHATAASGPGREPHSGPDKELP
jgi:cytochrome c-type biogenesis protein CcmH